jgi:hypothetical protein
LEAYVPDPPKSSRKAEFSPKFSRSRSREASPQLPKGTGRGSGRDECFSAKEEVKERSSLKISKIRVRDNGKDSSDSSDEIEQENISDNLVAVQTKASSDIIDKVTFSVAPTAKTTETVPPKIAANSS